jgi:hypothetical protein
MAISSRRRRLRRLRKQEAVAYQKVVQQAEMGLTSGVALTDPKALSNAMSRVTRRGAGPYRGLHQDSNTPQLAR